MGEKGIQKDEDMIQRDSLPLISQDEAMPSREVRLLFACKIIFEIHFHQL